MDCRGRNERTLVLIVTRKTDFIASRNRFIVSVVIIRLFYW